MLNGRTLLGILERQQTTRRGPTVWGMLGRIVGSLLIVAMVGAVLAFIGYRLWLSWETGQWDGFWTLAMVNLAFLFVPIFALLPLMNYQRRLLPALAPLREIAAAREDALTPPLIPQPPALLAEALPPGDIEIGPLKRLLIPNVRRNFSVFPSIMLVFVVPFIVLLLTATDIQLGSILPFGFDPFGGGSSGFDIFPFFMVGFYLLIFGLAFGGFVLRALPRWGQMTAHADAEGLRWRAGRIERALAWRDVRSFSRITTAGITSSSGVVSVGLGVAYLLDGPDASLIWTMSPSANDRQYAASELLCRLVVSRTNLPLRDLTAIANELAVARGNVQRVMRTRALIGVANPASPVLATLGQTPPPPQRGWRRVAPVFVISCIPLLLSAAIFGYGGWVENYQQGYFASLPQRLYAERPIFQDTLSTDDGYWPVSAVTAQSPQGQRFADGAYQLFGTDNTQYNSAVTIGAGTITDGVIEVTVSEHGTVGANTGEGIGLLFGVAGSSDNFGAFQIHADGSWDLYNYQSDQSNPANSWDYVVGGSSGAIHQGIGATNTLLLFKRGKLYLLYVNNQLIETYYDRDNVLPSSGVVGLYLNDDALTGDFSNLAVYPAQSAPAPW